MKKVLSILFAVCFLAVGCKPEVKKEQTSFKISGMTCEIGCAKTIATKLSKEKGVLKADVVFKDSLATVEYDANVTSKDKIMSFVNGLAGGKMYKTCDPKQCKNSCKGNKKMCPADCDKPCCANKKQCDKAKSKECPSKKECKKDKSCPPNCEKTCCKGKKECCKKGQKQEKSCKPDCKKPCCIDKK